MDVDELVPFGHRVQLGHGHYLVKAVVVLHELRQGLLQDIGAVLEVGKASQDLLVQLVQRALPPAVERHQDVADPMLLRPQLGLLLPLDQILGLDDEADQVTKMGLQDLLDVL